MTLKLDFAFLNAAEMTMTGTIEVGRTTIIGERMNPTGTRIESPGMDVVSQRVCTPYKLLSKICFSFKPFEMRL